MNCYRKPNLRHEYVAIVLIASMFHYTVVPVFAGGAVAVNSDGETKHVLRDYADTNIVTWTFRNPPPYIFKKLRDQDNPPNQYKYASISFGEYWTLLSCTTSSTAVSPTVQNTKFYQSVVADLDIVGASGLLVYREGEEPLPWSGEAKGISVVILDQPEEYFANSVANVPVVVEVDIPSPHRPGDPDDVTLQSADLLIEVNGSMHTVTIKEIARGDLYNTSNGEASKQNDVGIFTLVVDESSLDGISINTDWHAVSNAKWRLKSATVKVNSPVDGMRTITCSKTDGLFNWSMSDSELFVFGDSSIDVYELESPIKNIVATGQTGYKVHGQSHFAGYTRFGDLRTNSTSTYRWGDGPWAGKVIDNATCSRLKVVYDTNMNLNYLLDGDSVKLSFVDEKYGTKVRVVHGYSDISHSDGTTSDVLDKNKNEAWAYWSMFRHELTDPPIFTYEWGQYYDFDRLAGGSSAVRFGIAVVGLGLSVVGAVLCPPSALCFVTVAASTALSAYGVHSEAVKFFDNECGQISMGGAWTIHGLDGSRRKSGRYVSRSNGAYLEDVTLSSADGEANDMYVTTKSGNIKLYRGDKIFSFIVGGITIGSPSGTSIGDYDMDLELEIDINEAKLRISPFE